MTDAKRVRTAGGHCLAGLLALSLGALISQAAAPPLLRLGTEGAAQGRATQIPLWLTGATNLAGLQVDLIFDPTFVQSNGFAVTTPLAGVLADGGVVSSNRFRVLLMSTNRVPLANGLVASLNFVARSNSPNGLMRVPLRSQPAGVGVSLSTSGVCGSALAYQAGQFLVGDAFGFVPEGGRVQFRATDGSNYLFQASTNLEHWATIGTNVGLNDLVIWIDRDVTNYSRRFYRSRTP